MCPLINDLILGKKRCSTHKAEIDCERNIVKLRQKQVQYTINAIRDSYSEISINSTAFKENLAEIHAIAIKLPDRAEDPKLEKDLKHIISDFKDVFPEKLPQIYHQIVERASE